MDTIHPLVKASDLIQNHPKSWHMSKLQSLFDQTSIREILKIPLSQTLQGEDKEIWALNHSGKFSVKTAYHAQVDYHESVHQNQNSLFKPLWSLKIHDRHKLLLWKILWNILPTKAKISERISQQVNTECTFCDQEEETTLHLFVKCPIVRILWQQGSWPLNIERLPIHSSADWIKMIIYPDKLLGLQENETHHFQLYAVVLLDLLWKNRNEKVHNSSSFSLEEIKKQLATVYESFKNAWSICSLTKIPALNWNPPPLGSFSISFDATVRNDFSVASAIQRNHLGDILKIYTEKIASSIPLVAEAKAALLAIVMASSSFQSNSSSVTIEGDAQSVFSAIDCKDSTLFWSISPIVEDIRSYAEDHPS
ncbi:uncharacterized protein LOC122290971 [Carya illinoinensis]|uniref:Reverse transcriptase zinc-binding domain-containing protein n=1 Tax=Carya illinoinensis TaxID=32201 RepID=A0A8T1NP38_CARIL|nr:uncharacterized protein LOC122290971 [Carya illinoinensis]KAG6631738.1 hypothetical protein CIPAW_13G111200 [Carya illinoinensis]